MGRSNSRQDLNVIWITEVRWPGRQDFSRARPLTGGDRDGALMSPAVVYDPPRGCAIMTDEIFAPLVAVVPVKDVDDMTDPRIIVLNLGAAR